MFRNNLVSMDNPDNDYFMQIVRNIMSAEEDLAIARENGRPLDQWMQDRIDDIRWSTAELLRIWPIVPGHGTQVEPPCAGCE